MLKAENFKIFSLNKRIELNVDVGDNLSYSILCDKKEMLTSSSIS